jgi:mycothiol system anti-sigma-R factor
MNENIDCEKLLASLYQLVDGELSPSDRVALDIHMQDCGDCLQRVDVERRFKEVLRDKCLDAAPPGLADSIRAALEQEPLFPG